MEYEIIRNPEGDVQCVVWNPRNALPGEVAHHLPHVVYHSPTGFECGYAGSGPADLALSIMADYFGVEPKTMLERIRGWQGEHGKAADKTMDVYQHFKCAFIAPLRLDAGESHRIDEAAITAWLLDWDLPNREES